MKKVDSLKLLQDLDELNPMKLTVRQPLRFSSVTGAYVGPHAEPTIAMLSGSLVPLRNWHSVRYGIGQLRRALPHYLKWNEQLPIGSFHVPEDSVIHLKAHGQVLVLISQANRRVWKYDRSKHAATSQIKILESWRAFETAGMGDHMPAVRSSGKLKSETYFIESNLACNRTPLFRTLHGKKWPQTFASKVLPILQQFHDRNGFQIVDGPDWAAHLENGFVGRSLPNSMQTGLYRDLKRASVVQSPLMPLCMISGDLQPQNLHFDGDHCKILDWSNIKPAALITDVICDVFYRAMVTPKSPSGREFWQALSDPTIPPNPSSCFGRLCEIWVRWMDEWLHLAVTPSTLHLQLRLMCWDWLATMEHPWRDDGSLINAVRFPPIFLQN